MRRSKYLHKHILYFVSDCRNICGKTEVNNGTRSVNISSVSLAGGMAHSVVLIILK